jgi:hypothetical protein
MSACTDEADEVFDEQAATYEGIYRIDSHLLNDAACSPGGSAVDDQQTFAFAKRGEALGTPFLQIDSCLSLEDCRAKAAQAQYSGPVSFAYTLTGVDPVGLSGFEIAPGSSTASGWCEMPHVSALTLAMDGTAARLEKRTKLAEHYDADHHACSTEGAVDALQDVPCSQFETLTATRLEAL